MQGVRPGAVVWRPASGQDDSGVGACSREKVGLVRLYKFRALINLDGRDPDGPPG